MKKTFDCVEMKRKASERIYKETKGMDLAMRKAYWQEKHQAYLQVQARRKALLNSTSPLL